MDTGQLEHPAAETDEKSSGDASGRTFTPPQRPAKPPVTGLKKLAKNKKVLAAAGAGGLMLILLILFILFISLFKLNHIEKLVIDYEFAGIHRAMAKRSAEAIKEAKEAGANGDAETTITPDEPLAEQLKKADAKTIEEASSSPEKLTEITDNLNLTDKITTGEVIDSEFNVSRNFKPAEEDLPEEKVTEETNKQFQEKVQGTDGPVEAPNQGLQDKAKEVRDEVSKGADPEVALETASKDGLDTLSGAARIDKVIAYSTLFCIAYDIFHTSIDKFAKLKSGGFVREAMATLSAADAQKEGKLSSGQVNALNNKFDNGKQSMTDSCAYSRANYQPVDPKTCTELPEANRPFEMGGGGPVAGVINFLSGSSLGGSIVSNVCPVVLDPKFQLGLLTFSVAKFVSGGGALEEILARSVVQGVAIIGAVEGARYLVKNAISHYANVGVTGTEGPAMSFTNVDVGTKIMASETARVNGGRKLTPAESQDIKAKAHAGLILSDQKRGLAYRLFNINNPHSATAQMLAHTPSSPSAILASIGHSFATAFNPVKLSQSGSTMMAALTSPSVAMADTITDDPYGVPDYGLTDAELDRYKIVDNSKIVEANKAALDAKYAKCSTSDAATAFASKGVKNNSLTMCDDASNEELTRYHVYLFDRRVVSNLVLYGNNQAAGR